MLRMSVCSVAVALLLWGPWLVQLVQRHSRPR